MKTAIAILSLAVLGYAQDEEPEVYTKVDFDYASDAKAFANYDASITKDSTTTGEGAEAVTENFLNVAVNFDFKDYDASSSMTWTSKRKSTNQTGWYAGLGFNYDDMIEGKHWITCEQLRSSSDAAVVTNCWWSTWPAAAQDAGDSAVVVASATLPALTSSGTLVSAVDVEELTTTQGVKNAVAYAVTPSFTVNFQISETAHADMYTEFMAFKGKKVDSVIAYGAVFGASSRSYKTHPTGYDRAHPAVKWSGAITNTMGAAVAVLAAATTMF
eukprot:NODE_2340_length_942_cov_42.827548_g1923_i0.p1 GENE.NODE_2340_length_942_cov_42.827548_g1923_i0~~NODE_2340_length_942_cov_42.827548_g1923_i0.p1  ORF type:complete len:272 (-),score=59.12 NODE_2340_length_942_cov_42.827548_g1923_i0:60-875(-)